MCVFDCVDYVSISFSFFPYILMQMPILILDFFFIPHKGIHRLELMDVRKGTNDQNIDNSDDINGSDDKGRSVMSREENEAFLLMEKELKNELESEQNDDDDAIISATIGTEKGGPMDDGECSNKNKNNKNKEKNNAKAGEDENRVRRNGVLEFAVLLDESTASKLYLELIHGIENSQEDYNQKNNDNQDKNEIEKSVKLDDDVSPTNTTEKKVGNNSAQKRKLNTVSSAMDGGEKEIMLAEGDSCSKKMKMSKQMNIQTIFKDEMDGNSHVNDSGHEGKNETKKIKENREINTDENEKMLLEEGKKKLLNDVITEDSSSVKESSSSVKECSSSSLFLDDVTRERLRVLYQGCVGSLLEDLILSKEMLMLMGYTGSNGEEGV